MILVYGTICLDRVRSIAHYPERGGYAPVLGEQVFLGGEAANTANALQRWGREVKLAGNRLGEGELALQLEGLLLAKGLPIEHLARGSRTPVCEIYVSSDGDRTMFGYGFDDMGEAMDPGAAPYEAGAWFTADPNPGDAAREAIRLAHQAGMKLYLMDFIRENDPIPQGCFWQSSTDWAGVRGDIAANLGWVEGWVGRNGGHCILSDGANGIVAGSPDLPPRHFPAFPAPKLVDSTGAGDMLRAGMLLGLESDWSFGRSLAFGAGAASLKCGHLGATTHVPSVQEVLEFTSAHSEVLAAYVD